MTDGRDLPWLQDLSGGDVTTNWEVDYRDFVILDPVNEKPVAAYNLTSNPLSDFANREELKSILLGLAELKDDDSDKLSDYWEDEMFDGDRSGTLSDDKDEDNATGILEFTLGSDPDNPGSIPLTSIGSLTVGNEQYQTITFRQRLGAAGGLQCVVEFSQDGLSWSSDPGDVSVISRVNPYDGTGTEIVTYQVVQPVSAQGIGLLRVRVSMP